MTGVRHKPSRGRILRSGLAAGAFLVLGLAACNPSDHAGRESLVATVGSSSISRESFDSLWNLSRNPQPFGAIKAESIPPSPKDILAELVKEALLVQEIQDRGLRITVGTSPQDALAADLGSGIDLSKTDLLTWFETNRHLFSRKAQIRFFTVPLDQDQKIHDLSNEEFFAVSRTADRDAAGVRRLGDIGWLHLGNALWWPRTLWNSKAVGTTRETNGPEEDRQLVRAMHFRPAAAYRFSQVVNHCRRLMTTEKIQAEIRRILLRRAQTTPIAIIDETLNFELDPASIAQTEPGPALETIDPSFGQHSKTMVLLPGGSFTTGSTDAEIDERVRICRQYVEPALGEGSCARWKYEDEVQRRVTVKPFFMDRTEVRWEDYRVFVEATRHRPLPDHWSGEPGFPVANVSLEDAQEYCRWRGKRLPTADQWEFAARGIDGRRYPWGNERPDKTRANFCDSNCPKAWRNPDHDDGFAGPAPIGSYRAGATPEGLLDMGGNIREWTATTEGDRADVKGGGFFNAIDDLIAADVRRNLIDVRDPTIGFRCARDPETKTPGEGG